MDVKVGDVVHVRGTVLANDETGVLVDCSDTPRKFEISTRARVAPDKVVHVEPRPLQVGDKVRSTDGHPAIGELIAIHGQHAWVDWEKLGLGTERTSNLVRI